LQGDANPADSTDKEARAMKVMIARLADAPPYGRGFSAKLAVLASSAIDGRVDYPRVAFRLARDAGADARDGLAALLGNRLAAVIAFLCALALWSQRTGTKDRILHRIVDLVLNRAVARPTSGHCLAPCAS